jgi:hypothetical protein
MTNSNLIELRSPDQTMMDLTENRIKYFYKFKMKLFINYCVVVDYENNNIIIQRTSNIIVAFLRVRHASVLKSLGIEGMTFV